MREIITVVFFISFIILCVLLLFTKNSENYKKTARLPLDDDEIINNEHNVENIEKMEKKS